MNMSTYSSFSADWPNFVLKMFYCSWPFLFWLENMDENMVMMILC